jgi:hypothetical protein
MDSTRGPIALSYIRAARVDLDNSQRVLAKYVRLAQEYGCDQADIEAASKCAASFGYEPPTTAGMAGRAEALTMDAGLTPS